MKTLIISLVFCMAPAVKSQFADPYAYSPGFDIAFQKRIQSVCKQLFLSKYSSIKDSVSFVVQLPASPEAGDLYDSFFYYVNTLDSTATWGVPAARYAMNLDKDNLLFWKEIYLSYYISCVNTSQQVVCLQTRFSYDNLVETLSPADLNFLKHIIFLGYEMNYKVQNNYTHYPSEQDQKMAKKYFNLVFSEPLSNCLEAWRIGDLEATLNEQPISYTNFEKSYGFDTLSDKVDPVSYIVPTAMHLNSNCTSGTLCMPFLEVKKQRLWFFHKNRKPIHLSQLESSFQDWAMFLSR